MSPTPAVRVFVSYKNEDRDAATEVKRTLDRLPQVRAYMDVFDDQVTNQSVDDIGEHFRQRITECTHLLAVVSGQTVNSWWVPFEIGIATEKRYPIATFNVAIAQLPLYLQKWPYLTQLSQLSIFVQVAQTTERQILAEGFKTAEQRWTYSSSFHRELKRALEQL